MSAHRPRPTTPNPGVPEKWMPPDDVTIERCPVRFVRYSWTLPMDGYSVGGWSWTKGQARRAIRRELRRVAP